MALIACHRVPGIPDADVATASFPPGAAAHPAAADLEAAAEADAAGQREVGALEMAYATVQALKRASAGEVLATLEALDRDRADFVPAVLRSLHALGDRAPETGGGS